jgi:hypothetical protein
LLGFRNTLNVDRLYSFITNGGLHFKEIDRCCDRIVFIIRTLPLRNSRKYILVRLNVADNEDAQPVTSEGFWPSPFISWISRDARRRYDNQRQRTRINDNGQYSHQFRREAINAPRSYHQKQYVHKNSFKQLPEQLDEILLLNIRV